MNNGKMKHKFKFHFYLTKFFLQNEGYPYSILILFILLSRYIQFCYYHIAYNEIECEFQQFFIALQAGFRYHHAESDYLMLVYWIPHTPDSIPANASHRLGVGAFVVNNKREVIFFLFHFSFSSIILLYYTLNSLVLFDRCLWFRKPVVDLEAQVYGRCLLELLMKYIST